MKRVEGSRINTMEFQKGRVNMRDVGAAILSGGKNSRMGKNKAFIPIEGIPLIERTVDVLREIFEEIIIVTNSPAEYKHYQRDCLLVSDILKDIGPLGGIHAALAQTQNSGVFFVACDMPILHNDIIIKQVNLFEKLNCDALVPRMGSGIEPLHAVYSKKLRSKIEAYVKASSNYSVKGFLKKVNVRYLDFDDGVFSRGVFTNLNTPSEVKDFRKNYEDKE